MPDTRHVTSGQPLTQRNRGHPFRGQAHAHHSPVPKRCPRMRKDALQGALASVHEWVA